MQLNLDTENCEKGKRGKRAKKVRYIGETSRSAYERLKEHLTLFRNKVHGVRMGARNHIEVLQHLMTASAEIIYSALTINFVQVFQIIWPNSTWIVFNGRNPYTIIWVYSHANLV